MKAGILSLSRLYARAKESRFSRNVLWNVLGGVTSKITGPIFAILVARLIEPRDYGVFAIGVAVAAFFQIGKDLGLSQAIIVDDKNDEHLSLQFTVQLSWACLVYAVLYVLSPYVALAYGDAPELVSVLRILGLGFFVAAVVDPYATHHLKQQNYRFLFIRQVVPTVVGGILMLVLAHQGHGVYALVAGTLSSAIAAALVMAWGAGVLPRLTVNWPLLRRLFRLGKHITLQEFAGYLVQQADSIIVGRNLGPAMAGLYKIGNTIALIIPNSISSQIQQVVFTDMAERRKDPDFMVRRYYQFVNLVGSGSLLFSVLLYLLAPTLVPMFLGEQWQGTISVIQVFVIVIPFVPLVLLNLNISKILGFNHIYSLFVVGRSLLTITVVVILSFHSLMAVVVGWVTVGMATSVVNALLFFRYQRIIPPSKGLVALFIAGMGWGVIAIATTV